MERFVIDCRHVGSFEDFIEAMNVGLVRKSGGEWDGNLDALHDYLFWPKAESYELEILGSETCRTQLGHAAMASWLRGILRTCHSSNRPSVEQQLAQAQNGAGRTLFELLCDVIADNPHVQLSSK